MVKYYVAKIKAGEINPKTDTAWAIGDVPKLWRKKVEAELEKDTIE